MTNKQTPVIYSIYAGTTKIGSVNSTSIDRNPETHLCVINGWINYTKANASPVLHTLLLTLPNVVDHVFSLADTVCGKTVEEPKAVGSYFNYKDGSTVHIAAAETDSDSGKITLTPVVMPAEEDNETLFLAFAHSTLSNLTGNSTKKLTKPVKQEAVDAGQLTSRSSGSRYTPQQPHIVIETGTLANLRAFAQSLDK